MTNGRTTTSPYRFGLDLSAAQTAARGDIDLSRLKVLIVDDEPMLRSVIQDFLLLLGIEHQRVAGDGLEALEVIRSEPIDFMLSDIRMPKMELEELLTVIKKEFPRLVVVATSGFSDLESARNIFLKGAHDFLGKPLNLDSLELALNWIVERQRVLQVAERLFRRENAPVTPEAAQAALEELRATLAKGTHHFEAKMRHALRMDELLSQIDTGLDAPHLTDLRLAALLHELGNGYQIYTLCGQPRPLDEDERRLVREQASIAGRLASWALDRPEFQTILTGHQDWQILMARPGMEWPLLDRLAIWLGLVNTLDGYLHDRPDRPGISLAQMRQLLQRKMTNPAGTPPGKLLEQWAQVESFYRHQN